MNRDYDPDPVSCGARFPAQGSWPEQNRHRRAIATLWNELELRIRKQLGLGAGILSLKFPFHPITQVHQLHCVQCAAGATASKGSWCNGSAYIGQWLSASNHGCHVRDPKHPKTDQFWPARRQLRGRTIFDPWRPAAGRVNGPEHSGTMQVNERPYFFPARRRRR